MNYIHQTLLAKGYPFDSCLFVRLERVEKFDLIESNNRESKESSTCKITLVLLCVWFYIYK